VSGNEWRRKPGGTVIAVRWSGDNLQELQDEFMNSAGIYRRPEIVDRPGELDLQTIDDEWVPCPVGHWVIAEPEPDRFYPCDPAVFADRYEQGRADAAEAELAELKARLSRYSDTGRVLAQAQLPMLSAGSIATVRNGRVSNTVNPAGEEPSAVRVSVEWDPVVEIVNVSLEYLA
jgi:hypothetical protein